MKKANRTGTFRSLVSSIREIDKKLAVQAGRAVNISLTMRNWMIGCYIHNYELNGSDRSRYGDKLLVSLAGKLTSMKVSNTNRRQLYKYLQFYRSYPSIVGTVSPELKKFIQPGVDAAKMGTLSTLLAKESRQILNKLSYSHIELLVELEDSTKRAFYEMECIRGGWSVRELERQINSLYYERSGLSKNKKKLSAAQRLRQVCTRMDRSKDKLGYEINFNKEFYKYKPLRSLEEIKKGHIGV